VAIGVAGWAAFMLFATNQEKLSSSVFRSIVRALKADEQLKEVLGEAIRPQAEWYLNGDPHVKGHVSFFFFIVSCRTENTIRCLYFLGMKVLTFFIYIRSANCKGTSM
jgi:hypothetical protein